MIKTIYLSPTLATLNLKMILKQGNSKGLYDSWAIQETTEYHPWGKK
jgi:hypothetical protein